MVAARSTSLPFYFFYFEKTFTRYARQSVLESPKEHGSEGEHASRTVCGPARIIEPVCCRSAA